MKYIIICKTRGVFLGTYEKLGFFSRLEDFGCYKVPTFDAKHIAMDYATAYMDPDDVGHTYIYPAFDTCDEYVSCIDIIKAGYGEYTGNMIENLPNYHETEQ